MATKARARQELLVQPLPPLPPSGQSPGCLPWVIAGWPTCSLHATSRSLLSVPASHFSLVASPRMQQAGEAWGLCLRRNVEYVNDGVALKTLDIFAGCGGLSEGMHSARAADPMWAVEYESPAADAFRKNHPHAEVWTANCNVILTAAMRKAGQSGSCQASKEVCIS